MDIKAYWDKKIIDWENSIVKRGTFSAVEKLAGYFRKPLVFRAELCLKLLAPFINGKTILELGCGSGFFAFELSQRGAAKKIIGIDISPNAVKRAKEINAQRSVPAVCDFLEADASALATLPAADITIGLGFLDYLTQAEIKLIFEKNKSKYFLFTFSEKKFSLWRYVHILYLLSQRCPKHFYYTKRQISECIAARYGEIQFINHRKLSFCCVVHNLPRQ
ncbi:hypothetical protein COU00_03635 [Candidatus Falkowbacteria bacterium CG10_big_fil_rev_8_21_14_0_10_43_11]|uniref:Methyltransferase domain-containing protein n=1 Tax=Candidatus Falkowbacteria bacterium CG10_big_fil_rev_8_21_14_0_10_43_11 TaxID=1974568 RepID=A0A2M6WLA2_9BACT|nr:MAG: hypothetical protein COU00_03635 [Candidatus Falkowbacteria bacterium CG10_big_fil_rev_8_21_14_0_10_43_11]